MTIRWEGIYPAITTQFFHGGALDMKMFEHNLRVQLAAGIDGIILGGTLGESSVLSDEEKESLVKISLERSGGKIPVLLNIAEGDTKSALQQVRLAEDWGADGLMVLPPLRYRSDHSETVTWFRTIAQSTHLPVMIYNNPVDYNVLITFDMLEELKSVGNIQAIKESTRDVTNITRMRNHFGDRYKILCGVDTIALEAFCLGADGWVAGLVNAFPGETVAIYRLARAGRTAEALAIYRWFMPLLEMDLHPKLVQYIKLAQQETGTGCEVVREPRLILQGEERARILEIVRKGIATRPQLTEQVKMNPAMAR